MNTHSGGGDHRPEQPRHDQQGHPAEPVVDEQQQPRVHPVGQPAGADRADDVEDADHRQQAGRGRPAACRGRARPG